MRTEFAHPTGLRRESVCAGREGKIGMTSPAFRVVDPVGSGDAFCAGFLHGLLEDGPRLGLELGGAMKQSIPGDAPQVRPDELSTLLAGTEAAMSR